VQIEGEIAPARLQVRDQRGSREDVGDVVEREAHARLVRDRRQVQPGVGRAAGRGDRGAGVLERLPRHEIARQRPALEDDLGRSRAGAAGQREALGVRRRQHRRARQREAERLGDHRHGVGGELAGARAERRRAGVAELVELGFGHAAGEHRADAFVSGEDRHVLAAPAAGQHRAAVDEDARHVDARHRHHDAGQRLVAAGEADQRVVGVRLHHRLDRVGDQLARDEAHAHAAVVHRDAVGDRDRRERDGDALRGGDAEARGVGLRAERHRARRVLAVLADDADDRLCHVLVGHAGRAQERAMRRAVEALLDDRGAQLLHVLSS
jgi:hypothetical protein